MKKMELYIIYSYLLYYREWYQTLIPTLKFIPFNKKLNIFIIDIVHKTRKLQEALKNYWQIK
jgi:hypothetical protein